MLPEPKVSYRKQVAEVRNGSWNMDKIQFMTGGSLRSWDFVRIQPNYSGFLRTPSMEELRSTIPKFWEALRRTGVTVDPNEKPSGVEIEMGSPSDPSLDELFRKASATQKRLLLIVLPGRDKTDSGNSELYNYIKTLGDTKYGIHTICVIGQKFCSDRGQPQYFANVALKFNLKLGGNNQSVEPARLSFITENKTMLVGIDVTHPSPGSSDYAPSVAGMVASIDGKLGQWPGILSVQAKARQEMVSHLTDMLKKALDNWIKLGKHAQYPDNIIVYRDGVSEGQYDLVRDQEIPLLETACREVYPADLTAKNFPRISVIIVGKRHHTRFYPKSDKDMDRSGNCKPGTVVDRGITEEGYWDFFLQSHAAIQGTARPAHYVVIRDDIFRSRARAMNQKDPAPANALESITQALCYSYSRATKAVSLCTPAYHADVLCERSRRYLSDLFEGSVSDEASTVSSSQTGFEIHPNLRNTMFYI